jgi:hypothetical protein
VMIWCADRSWQPNCAHPCEILDWCWSKVWHSSAAKSEPKSTPCTIHSHDTMLQLRCSLSLEAPEKLNFDIILCRFLRSPLEFSLRGVLGCKFRPEFLNSVPIRCFCPQNYGIHYMNIPDFSGVFHYITLANRPFCTTPPIAKRAGCLRNYSDAVDLGGGGVTISNQLFIARLWQSLHAIFWHRLLGIRN